MRRTTLAGLGALAALSFGAPAHAQPGHFIVSGDFESGGSLQLDGSEPVTGAGVRAGYGFDLAILEVIPEARFMVYTEPEGEYGTAELGGRVMFLKVLEPGVYGRLVMPFGGQGPGFGFTTGGMLDLTAIPVVDLGLHGGIIAGVKGASWVGGAHVSMNF